MEFYDLLAEEQINPRGEERADLRNAIASVTIARGFGSKKAEVNHFMPKFEANSTRKLPTQDELEAKFKAWGNMNKVARQK